MSDLTQQYEELKRKVKKASYNVFITNNQANRDAYDQAIEELMEFEKEHGIEGRK